MHIDWATLVVIAVVAAAASVTVVLLVAFALVGLSARAGAAGQRRRHRVQYPPRRRHRRRRALCARRRAHRLLRPVPDHCLSNPPHAPRAGPPGPRPGRSERCRDGPRGEVRSTVVASLLPLGQRDVVLGQRLVGDLAEQVTDDVEPAPLLVIGLCDESNGRGGRTSVAALSVDLPEPLRSPTCRPSDSRADRTAGPRERDLGLPAHSRRTAQARPLRRRLHDPQDPQAAAHTSGPAPSDRYFLATVPARPGLDPAGRGLLPRRLRDHPETDLRVLRPRGPQPLRRTSSGRPATRPEPGPPNRPATY